MAAAASTERGHFKPSWADQVEEEETDGRLPSPKETISGNVKTVTEYEIDEAGKKFKVVRTFRIETRTTSRAAVRRKTWKKFGNAEFDAPGPNAATTTVGGDDVLMTFVSGREDLNAQDHHHHHRDEDPMEKLKGQKMVTCRVCKGDHWTTRCPYKDTLLATGAGEEPKPRAGGAGGASGESEAEKPSALLLQSKTGKYVPPSLRDGATARRGESMQSGGRGGGGRGADDNATIRVSNLSEDAHEEDLQELFRPFGALSRTYLVKDKVTGQSKGSAFISFHHQEDAARALAKMSGYGYDHLILNVEWAKPSNNQ